jgi:hypothetical protein
MNRYEQILTRLVVAKFTAAGGYNAEIAAEMKSLRNAAEILESHFKERECPQGATFSNGPVTLPLRPFT